jgi:hypothetical protein
LPVAKNKSGDYILPRLFSSRKHLSSQRSLALHAEPNWAEQVAITLRVEPSRAELKTVR